MNNPEDSSESVAPVDAVEAATRDLVRAIRQENVPAVRAALEQGADPSRFSKERFVGTPLHIAVETNLFQITQILLTAGADKEVGHGTAIWTPLHVAVSHDLFDITELLLKAGSNPNARDDDDTLLHLCESAQIARILLVYGADLEAVNEDGWTALHSSCFFARLDVVRELINNHEPNLFARDHLDKTPLDVAYDDNEHEVVDLLLSHYEGDIFHRYARCSLHSVLRAITSCTPSDIHLSIGKLDRARGVTFLKSLLDRDPEAIRTRDDQGDLPIHIACSITDDPVNLIEFLTLQDRATLQIQDRLGRLPIHVYSLNEDAHSLAGFKLLLETGGAGTLTARDQTGSLPLHLLCHNQKPWWPAVKLLLESHPGSVSTRNGSGDLPLTLASKKASLSVLYELVRANPRVVPSPPVPQTRNQS